MNAFATAVAQRAADDRQLLDVLPCRIDASHVLPAERELCDFALAPAAMAALHELGSQQPLQPSALLCTLLALVESRLLGTPSVVASLATSAGLQQTRLPMPRSGTADAWLASCAEAPYIDACGSANASAWVVVDDVKHAGCGPLADSLKNFSSEWRLYAAEPARLQISFKAPMSRAAVELLCQSLGSALATLTASPTITLDAVTVISAADRQRILREWNDTARPRRPNESVPGLFAETVQHCRDAIAIESGDITLTYAELDARANRVAAGLLNAGAIAGAPVALVLGRSPEALIALLGILKAGAAYLPLDPGHPPERLALVINAAGAGLVITGNGAVALPGVSARCIPFEQLQCSPALAAAPTVAGDALAYVMLTSGSSGTPKGVEITHRSIIRLVRDVSYIDLTQKARVLHAAPLGFDASTLEIWGALLNGGTCVIHHETIPTACGLQAVIRRYDVRIAWLTAALFNAIVDEDARKLDGIEQLFIGGEALSIAHVRKAYAALPHVVISNGYGPTECTTFAATYRIPRELAAGLVSIPIGRPIADTTLYVLNALGEAVPVGVAGELYIGGSGLARGYLARAALSAERFVFKAIEGSSERLYRTGDLVRWRAEGVLEFIGRADDQVKIRGHRIELGEIEAALQQLPGLRACCVLAREDQPGQKRLVAYYVSDDRWSDRGSADGTAPGASPVTARSLRAQLAQALPEFMVPAIYLRLATLPMTQNGKIDRRALPAPDRRRPELADTYVPARGALEQRLCGLFADILGLDQVGRRDNFFDLGGHSLLAVQTLARIHAEVSPEPSITHFFSDPTPAALAATIAGNQADTALAGRLVQPAGSNASAQSDPVAIIAMAGRFPGANDVEAFWDNLCAGRESITFFAPEDLDPGVPLDQRDDPAYVAARGVIDGVEYFDAAFFGIAPREAELMDPQQRIFLELCWSCLERGGYVPDAHAGPVGIFGGMHNATYFQRHLSGRPELVEKLGAFQVMLGNEKDYFTTRVAHKLNLTGPAISLNTACSTSLVAIAQAFHALRSGQCDMALAGGVSVTCPPRSGYLAQEGSMLSPDGHTRSFDAHAQGTVFSDGAAVILLKRLSAALRDGDPVYAVIRGAAVNNDGAIKASFTAPSSAGQAAVISMALASAGVDARSISYVEAHGTATPVGDPIELQGLTQAFRRSTDERAFCALGSVKSNVGHMVMAAGAAGVIKTALALQQQQLPPTLHFKAANPTYDLANSPFVVNHQLRAWPAQEGPRRAGVSSFGVGGTNAHVILEEPPLRAPSDRSNGAQLLLLCARTASALARVAAQLGAHLQSAPDTNLADVAWTLANGRKPFAQRAHMVASTVSEAVEKLRALDQPALARVAVNPAPGAVFLFPGQGSQYPGMGRELYATEPAFRAALDQCADSLRDELGFDLRQRLFDSDAAALRATSLTQPALFAVEYALARLWMSYGIQPVAMIGHSVGEFVAAVLADVMSLADGARLVARRGRLMQALPTGAMLSVRLDAEQLSARLPAALSLAAVNAPNACVVAGETAEVEAFRHALEKSAIACRLLHTAHAFHSKMMDSALAPFRQELDRVALSAPKIRIISTLTGRTLDDAEATSADYWTRQLRGTVQFSNALQSVLADPGLLFLEVGPRATLATLTRQQRPSRQPIVLASLADTPTNERAAFLEAAGQLWSIGAPLQVGALDQRAHKRRLRLPTYPFERERHWIDAPAAIEPAVVPAADWPRPARPHAALPDAGRTPLPVPHPELSMNVTHSDPQPVVDTADIAGARRPTRLLGELKALFEDITGTEFADADNAANFIELGLDSLSLTQVALQLQKTYALKITFRELMEASSSFERLTAHIDRRLPPDATITIAATAGAATPAPATMAIASMPTIATTAAGSAVQDIIQQQMAIMRQQLALLAQASSEMSPAAPAPTHASAMAATAAVHAAPTTPTPDPAQEEEAAPAHATYDVRKAFGAIARIHSTSTELSARQRARLDAFMRRYIERTQASKAYTQEHRPHLADPRVVNGFRPLLKEVTYQIVVERSKGSKVWDIDGNEYVDALNGFGMNLFGWQPDFVLDAVRRQLDAGYEIGPQHPLAGIVAKKVCELTGFDRAALCNTGSEAVMGTVRIARTVTGRDTLVIFSGSYHGIFDEVIVRGTKKLRSLPAAPGILRNTSENVLVLDYGTPESLAIIRERSATIAAVLVEPVQSRRPDFQPREFLQELRAITSAAGTLLIFDEVVTGFRAHPGGAQAVLGIEADLASYGKVIGGGFPIGIIAGRRQYMDALDGGGWQFGDASIPTVGVTYFAGTFVRHPLALAAANAVLDHLMASGSALQDRLNARTTSLIDELNSFCLGLGAPIRMTHFASVWKVNFAEDHPLQDLLFAMMRSRGIHVLDNFPCFFTTAHSESDFVAIAKAFKESVLELQEADFLPRRKRVDSVSGNADKPPVSGARLGRDEQGKPAWFVPNPEAPGKFLRVNA